MTGTELDDILADNDTQEATEQTQETAPTETTVARDEHGRFAPKANEAEVATEQQVQPAVEIEPGRVPQQALHASREKEREARQEAETLRTQLAQMQGQIELLSRQTRQPQAAPKVEEQKPLEPWDEGYTESILTPLQQQLQQQAERFSMRMAVKEYGKDTVQTAYAALGAAMQAGDPSARAEYQRIKQSDDPYEDIVQWHKRSQTLKTVGDDPNAWLEAELEKRLSDPTHQAKILERIQATAAQNVTRSNPNVKLPPSLTRLPAGGNAPADVDVSDAGLFSHALR